MGEIKHTKAFYNTEIPSDWNVKKFEKIAKFFSGGTPLTSKPEYYSGNIPFIKSGEIYFDKTEQFISDEGLKNSSAKMVEKGDLLYALYGANSGEVAISKINGAINQAILCIRHNGDCETVFIYNYLLQQKENIIRTYLQGGQGNLSAEIVKTLPIPLPPLPEQKAIAQVLSTADAAIHTTEKLIAQKGLRKKWLMQQLLTGKKRLNGFSGGWKEVRLDQVTQKFSRRNKDLVDARVYSVTNTKGFVLQSEHFDREVAGEDLSNYKIIRNGEFAYNPARVNVGSLAYFTEDTGVISSLYVCFRTTEEILDYILLQILKLDHTIHKINSYGEGGVRVYLWYELFGKIKISLPPIKEQTAIAQVLQAADKEISLLKAKAEKLRDQKKGLMQQLLTGKKRLTV